MPRVKKPTKTCSDEDSEEQVLSDNDRRCRYCAKLLQKSNYISSHEKQCSKAISSTEKIVTSKDGRKVFLCEICSKTFQYLSGILRHKKRHEPPGGYVCIYCKQRFCKETDLLKHKQDEHKIKCPICHRTFNSDTERSEHIDSVHKERNYYLCENCGQKFPTPGHLKNHTDSKCGAEKRFKCSECGLNYMTKGILKSHKLIHKGEKKYSCKFCGQGFLLPYALGVHLRRHTGEKPYKCETCSKSFAHEKSLVTHLTTHTGIKPYVCECCGARFSCFGNLQQHRRRRPSTCDLPEYKTNTKKISRPSFKNLFNTKTSKSIAAIIPELGNNSDNIEKKNDCTLEEGNILPDQLETKDSQTELDIVDHAVKANNIKKKRKKRKNLSSHETNFKIKLRSSVSQPKIEKIEDQSEITEETEKKPTDLDLTLLNNCNSQSSNDTKYNFDNTISQNIDKCNIKEEIQNPVLKIECEPFIYQPSDVLSISCDTDIKIDHVKDEKIIENVISVRNIKHDGSDDEIAEGNDSDNDNYSINTTNENNTQSDEDYSILSKSKKQRSKIKKPTAITRKQKGNQEHKCSLCPKIYFHRTKLLTHLKNDHKTNEETYKNQLNDDEFADSMKCKYCDRRYKKIGAYKNHLKEHGPDGKLIYKSVCCREYFATEDEAKKHTETVHYDRITCFDCDRSYSDPHALQRHKYCVHKNDKNKDDTKDCDSKMEKLQCKMCTRKFANKTALSDHERSNCGKNPLYKCEECGKHYHSAGSLKGHMSLHTGEKPHLCQFCGKSFRTIHQVRDHQIRHSGDKPYKCEMCPKAFAYRSSLINHFSSHTGQRRFECKNCGMRFSCISNLQAHRKTKSRTCGNLPNDTKPIEYIGVVGGTIALGNKYTQQFKKRVKEVL